MNIKTTWGQASEYRQQYHDSFFSFLHTDRRGAVTVWSFYCTASCPLSISPKTGSIRGVGVLGPPSSDFSGTGFHFWCPPSFLPLHARSRTTSALFLILETSAATQRSSRLPRPSLCMYGVYIYILYLTYLPGRDGLYRWWIMIIPRKKGLSPVSWE